jgi:hypothetical protein
MSRGLGRAQRGILQTLLERGPQNVNELVDLVYETDDYDDVYRLGPTVRRALNGMERQGLVKRTGELPTRTGSYKVVWDATRAGEVELEKLGYGQADD